jgi:hypothetical protein
MLLIQPPRSVGMTVLGLTVHFQNKGGTEGLLFGWLAYDLEQILSSPLQAALSGVFSTHYPPMEQERTHGILARD